MKEQVLPLVKASVSNEDKASKKVKCRFENVGKCKLKDKCKDFHPQKICQQFSKFGSCSIDSVCELRHPEKTCFEWESYGTCSLGDKCRYTHPIVFQSGRYFNNFLAHRLDHPGSHSQEYISYQQNPNTHPTPHQALWKSGQGQRYHDLRGRRW